MNIAVNLHSSELDIIQACIRKEEWAQQWVYEEFHHSMLGVCMRYASSENEAMDLLHEGFLKVEEIMTAIQKLSPIYRSVFNLYVIEGFSHKEISEKLGITESTSRSNLVKARIKLKELLHESGE